MEHSKLWVIIHRWLQPIDRDAAFWWQSTGSAIANMLSQAGYDQSAQLNALLFHFRYIINILGPSPSPSSRVPSWRSFMTDDFSPLEYSWSWDGDRHPKIRYSVEAIGRYAGSSVDPFNRRETCTVVEVLRQALPCTDWRLFEHFLEALYENEGGCEVRHETDERSSSSASSLFLAFEFGEEDIAVKAYFMPVRSTLPAENPFSVVARSIRDLLNSNLFSSTAAYLQLQDFVQTHHLGQALELVCVAIDCVDPSISRIKCYVRSPSTSFDNVCAIMTLGRTTSGAQMKPGLQKLKRLWQLSLGLQEGFSSSHELDLKLHQTAGVLYYFDIRPRNTSPEPKVYIPVRHYGHSDRDVLKGLEQFLREEGLESRYIDGYRRLLETLATHRTLDSGCGLQSYISAALTEQSLSLTSYIAPELYHPRRWM